MKALPIDAIKKPARRLAAACLAAVAAAACLLCNTLADEPPAAPPLPTCGKATLAAKQDRTCTTYSVRFKEGASAAEIVDFLCTAVRYCQRREGDNFFQLSYEMAETPRWGEEFVQFFKASRWYNPQEKMHCLEAPEARQAYDAFVRGQLKARGVDLPPSVRVVIDDFLLVVDEKLLGYVRLLFNYQDGAGVGVVSHDALTQAIMKGDKEAVRRIIQSGTSPNRRAEYRMYESRISLPPLAEVIWHYGGGFPDPEKTKAACGLIELLVDLGADPNINVLHGNTPLHMAAGVYHEGIVEFSFFGALMDCGADWNIKNDKGETPRDCVRENLLSP